MNTDVYANNYNRLTSAFLQNIAKGKDNQNVILSSFSILTSLLIAADATDGKTCKELKSVLSGNLDYGDVKNLLISLHDSFAHTDIVSSANAVLVKNDIGTTIKEEFEHRLLNQFGGKLFRSADMVNDANVWVKEKTRGMIDHIADDSMKRMLLSMINAVVFKAEWMDEYFDDDIREEYFYNANRTKKRVKMMHSEERGYIDNAGFIGFTKPYKGGDFSFMAVLPKIKTLRISKKQMMKIDFSEMLSYKKAERVSVDIPEYTSEFTLGLKELLQELGVKTLFTELADFSPITSVPLKVDRALHMARIDVDRRGTRAAAASMFTAIYGGGIRNMPKKVKLNRPFVYAIMHNKTGLPIFVGIQNQI